MQRRSQLALATAATALALVMIPVAASATSWGILNVYEYNTLRGQAHGSAVISGGTRAVNSSVYSGTPAAGTRVETQYEWFKLSASGQYTWLPGARKDTPTWNSTVSTSASVSSILDPAASKVRMVSRICVPKPWGTPVPCSVSAYVSHDY
jgi:hypothetical protein